MYTAYMVHMSVNVLGTIWDAYINIGRYREGRGAVRGSRVQ